MQCLRTICKKQKHEYKNLRKQDSRYIYQNEPDKDRFQCDITWRDLRICQEKTASENVLRNKTFDFGKNPKHDGYQRGLASTFYKCFDKKSSSGAIKSKIISNQRPLDIAKRQLAAELHKSIIRKLEKQKVYTSFTDNTWGADLPDMQLISKIW